jgi:hypothetical protein
MLLSAYPQRPAAGSGTLAAYLTRVSTKSNSGNFGIP